MDDDGSTGGHADGAGGFSDGAGGFEDGAGGLEDVAATAEAVGSAAQPLPPSLSANVATTGLRVSWRARRQRPVEPRHHLFGPHRSCGMFSLWGGARRPPQRRRPRRLPPLPPSHMCSLSRTRLLATHRRRRRLAWVAAAAVAEAVGAALPASVGGFPAGGRRASVAAAARHGGGGHCLSFVLTRRFFRFASPGCFRERAFTDQVMYSTGGYCWAWADPKHNRGRLCHDDAVAPSSRPAGDVCSSRCHRSVCFPPPTPLCPRAPLPP